MNLKLKLARMNKKITQADIAKFANISERQYRRIEAGEHTPSVNTALLIAKILDSAVETLFN